jgi:uncharacterized membrane protein HdeD (DUF308 family)
MWFQNNITLRGLVVTKADVLFASGKYDLSQDARLKLAKLSGIPFVMAVFFLVGGLYQLIASAWTHLPGWDWQALNGVLATVMGVLIMAQWPVSGLWVIGLFIRIDLIVYGGAWIKLALDLHKM